MHPHHLQVVLSFYLAKAIKIIEFTKTIKSDQDHVNNLSTDFSGFVIPIIFLTLAK
jgi:hypothetical protein